MTKRFYYAAEYPNGWFATVPLAKPMGTGRRHTQRDDLIPRMFDTEAEAEAWVAKDEKRVRVQLSPRSHIPQGWTETSFREEARKREVMA